MNLSIWIFAASWPFLRRLLTAEDARAYFRQLRELAQDIDSARLQEH